MNPPITTRKAVTTRSRGKRHRAPGSQPTPHLTDEDILADLDPGWLDWRRHLADR